MPTNRAQFLFDTGLSFIQKREHEKASTYFKEAILEEPQFHEALYNLACCQAVLGDKDNALIYLSRAVKLNMHCIDWAKEDTEFDSIRDDPLFNKVVNFESGESGEDFAPMLFPTVENEEGEDEDVDVDDLDEDDDLVDDLEEDEENPKKKKKKKRSKVGMPNLKDEKEVIEDLPPCEKCSGILHTEKRTKSSPKKLAFTLALGMVLCFFMYYTIIGMAGFFVIAYGLYSLTKVHQVWVCNSCGSEGEECGQTKDLMKVQQVEKLEDLDVKKKK